MMMNTGQRVEKVKLRAHEKCRIREKHVNSRLALVSAMLCCCLIYAASYFFGKSPGAVQGLSGATLLPGNAGGYVLVGVVCFASAVAVTMLCLRAKERAKKYEKQTKENEEK